jgi:hypothetical protein
MAEEKLFKRKQYRMRYCGSGGNGCVITLPFDPRNHICKACHKSVIKNEIKITALHHFKYAYKPETVKANPILILDNTAELCFPCHQAGDGLMNILKQSPERVLEVAKLMPKDLLSRYSIICKMYLEWYNKNA